MTWEIEHDLDSLRRLEEDDFEGMIAAQLIAAHCSAMECYRRAMVSDLNLFSL